MMFGAVTGIYLLYVYVLRGNFANRVVDFLHKQFHMDYVSANKVYRYLIRNHIELVFAVSIVALFLVIFGEYLKGLRNIFWK